MYRSRAGVQEYYRGICVQEDYRCPGVVQVYMGTGVV
jgi:hypothetical protein